VILQLNQLAKDSGITFDQITPNPGTATTSAAVPTTTGTTDPFAVEPIQVQFSGSFYDLVTFLQRLRNLVRVDHGRLTASGRLFDVSDIAFCQVPTTSCGATTGSSSSTPVQSTFPHVQAVLTINAFVPQQPQTATTVPGSTATTSTTTTGTTTGTTTTMSNSTSAAPSTSGGTS
jgi:hypothetical protein